MGSPLPARPRPSSRGSSTRCSSSPVPSSPLVRHCLSLLINEQFRAAEPYLRECLAIREGKQPDAFLTFSTKSMLGESLMGQQKYVHAEPLLRSGYLGMNQRVAQVPPQGVIRLTEGLERLVRFYEATGNADEAAIWRKELQ